MVFELRHGLADSALLAVQAAGRVARRGPRAAASTGGRLAQSEQRLGQFPVELFRSQVGSYPVEHGRLGRRFLGGRADSGPKPGQLITEFAPGGCPDTRQPVHLSG